MAIGTVLFSSNDAGIDSPGRDDVANTAPDAPSGFELAEFDIAILGTISLSAGPSLPAASVAGVCTIEVGEDWYDRIHVLPRRIDFGNILGNVETEITIFSSFLSQNVTWTATNLLSGMTLEEDLTPPTGVTSVQPPPPSVVFEPLTGVQVLLQVGTDGVPQFADDLDFVFDVGTTPLPVTGSRVIMFPYQPEMPLREELEFLTDIMEHRDGSEQRVALRKNPRQSFSMRFVRTEGTESSRIDFLMFDWQDKVFGVPVWPEVMSMTTAVTGMTTDTISVDSTDYTDLRVGGIAIILQPDEVTFEALEIQTINPTSIVFTTQIQETHPAGTKVYPIRTAVTEGLFKGERSPIGASTFDIKFRVLDNDSDLADASAFNTLAVDGKVLLDDCNFIDRVLKQSYQRRVVQLDNQSGVFLQESPWTRNRRGSAKTFIAQSRQEVWETRQLLHFFRGRQISWWLPTFSKEIEPTTTLTGSTMTFTNVGYDRFVQGRAPKDRFRITFKDGSTPYDGAVSSTAVIDKNTEQITFDTAFGGSIEPEDIDRVMIMEKVRIDSDRIPIVHEGRQARISFPVKVVFE